MMLRIRDSWYSVWKPKHFMRLEQPLSESPTKDAQHFSSPLTSEWLQSPLDALVETAINGAGI